MIPAGVRLVDLAKQEHENKIRFVMLEENFGKMKLAIARYIFKVMGVDNDFDDLVFETKDFVIDSNVGDISPENAIEVKILLEDQDITEYMLKDEVGMTKDLDIYDFKVSDNPVSYYIFDEDKTPIKDKIEEILHDFLFDFETAIMKNVDTKLEISPKVNKKYCDNISDLVRTSLSMLNRFHMLEQVMELNAELMNEENPDKILKIVSKYVEIIDD